MDVSSLLQSGIIAYLGYYVYCTYDPVEANRPMHYALGLGLGAAWYWSGKQIPVVSKVTDTIAGVA